MKTRSGVDSPFGKIKSLINGYCVCLNLEASLKGERVVDKAMAITVDRNELHWLPKEARVISMVNNHVDDSSDPEALKSVLIETGRTVVGGDNPAVCECVISGKRIAFFSAYFALPRLRVSYNGDRKNRLLSMLSNNDADVRVVNLHWGYEHTDVPAPFQRKLARQLVDAGASVIIGHHPHVAQGWERYKGIHIFYSLGNFNFWQFDSEMSEKNKWGYAVAYSLETADCRVIPYKINGHFQPMLPDEKNNKKLLKTLDKLQQRLSKLNWNQWFLEHYRHWYAHEVSVWCADIKRTKNLLLVFRLMVWLVLPMQLMFYFFRLTRRKGANEC